MDVLGLADSGARAACSRGGSGWAPSWGCRSRFPPTPRDAGCTAPWRRVGAVGNASHGCVVSPVPGRRPGPVAPSSVGTILVDLGDFAALPHDVPDHLLPQVFRDLRGPATARGRVGRPATGLVLGDEDQVAHLVGCYCRRPPSLTMRSLRAPRARASSSDGLPVLLRSATARGREVRQAGDVTDRGSARGITCGARSRRMMWFALPLGSALKASSQVDAHRRRGRPTL